MPPEYLELLGVVALAGLLALGIASLFAVGRRLGLVPDIATWRWGRALRDSWVLTTVPPVILATALMCGGPVLDLWSPRVGTILGIGSVVAWVQLLFPPPAADTRRS